MPNASEFVRFSRAEFEARINHILHSNRAGFISDITREWREAGKETWEHIYRITTKNPAVDIIVFSSVDIRTNRARNNGDDRVRLVMRWKTRNGERFRRIARHNRISTLFDNVKDSIITAHGQVFECGRHDWSPILHA
jgi:hypothetical protein